MVPNEAGTYLNKHLTDSSFVLFDNSSHCPFLEEPKKFNKEIEAFVKQCSKS
jgi:pimeloyl-ACP methyl ester carboxylesterase